MSSQPDNIEFLKQMLTQMSGYIVVMDTNSKAIYSNDSTAQTFGFTGEEALLGHDAYDMRCPAVECAEDFIKQDKYVQKTGSTLTILDIHGYAQGQQKIILTKKTPFHLNGKLVGSICHGIEIYSTSLARISGALLESDKQYYPKNKKEERTYTIGAITGNNKLTKRELECVFYWIRGYTVKEMGKTLGLSPRTVEAYINSIKLKWGCQYKSEAIKYALVNGYFSYVPQGVLDGNFSTIIHSN